MDPSQIAPVTLQASMGLAFYLAVGVIFAVNGIRWLLEVLPTTKTNGLPGWIWVLIANALAVTLCYFLRLDQIGRLFELNDVVIPAPWSYIATGFAIGMSSNILYLGTQPLRQKYRDKRTGKLVTLAAGEQIPADCLPDPTPAELVEESSTKPEALTTSNVINGYENNVHPENGSNPSQEPRGRDPSADEINHTVDPESAVSYAPAASADPGVLLSVVDVSPARPMVFLTPEGKLYRVSDRGVEYLPRGWNG